MARYANKQNLRRLVEDLREEYKTPSWVKDAEELGSGLEVSDGTLSVKTTASGDGSPVDGPISELSAEGWATQFSTTGKNLIDCPSASASGAGYPLGGSRFPLSLPSGTYTLSFNSASASGQWLCAFADANSERIVHSGVLSVASGANVATLTANADIASFEWYINTAYTIDSAQLELGSTATEYEPYHHTTTPIPLPSRGWVGSLPDGTADVLHLDGAGKVEWEKKTEETTTSATDGVTGTVGTDVLSTTGQIADGATVLYKQAPVTESLGYIDLPDIPAGSTVTIPELEELGVSYFVDNGAISKLAEQWYTRASTELGDAIVDLAQRVSQLEQ